VVSTRRFAALVAIGIVLAGLSACSPKESVFDLAAPRTLRIATYEGSGQLVHPDVVRWPAGGSDLWMAATPYPNTHEKWENPSIYQSRDGLTWTEPVERENPVVSRPPCDHNCDPDLVPAGKELDLFYLESERAKLCTDGRNLQNLRVCTSTDGRKWSKPTTVIHWDLDHDPFYLSPCIVPAGGGWRLFLVWPKGRTIEWLSSTDLRKFGEPRGVMQTGLEGVRPWHLDIFPVDGGWVALLCARGPDARDNLDVDLWIGASPDLERWSFRAAPFLAGGDPTLGIEIVYRSTGLLRGNRLAIWYSGRTSEGHWLVGATSCDAAVVTDLLAAAAASPALPPPPPPLAHFPEEAPSEQTAVSSP
jgi:hypothetical protein